MNNQTYEMDDEFSQESHDSCFSIKNHVIRHAGGNHELHNLVGDVLAYCPISQIEEYINIHKDGWVGVDGEFARILAKVLQALK